MRILCQQSDVRNASVHEGWGRVFAACGHEFAIWRVGEKPAFDAFDETNPQLFIGDGQAGRSLDLCLSERRNLVISVVDAPMPAADTFLCDGAATRDELKCDVAFVGNYRDDKRGFIDSYLGAMVGQGGLNVKVFGREPSPYVEYLGSASDATVRDLYASATISANISRNRQPSDRVYQILLCGGVCVSTRLDEPPVFDPKSLGGVVTCASTPGEFVSILGDFTSPSKEVRRSLRAIRRSGRDRVLDHHTYWNRCHDILHRAGFPRDAARVMEVYRATVRV